jgi:uncharacterized protein (DUF2062 family)
VVPLKRAPHPPEWAARGTCIGLIWGLTPTVGIQVLGVFVTWIVARRLFRYEFGMLIAMVWTSVTNVVTAIPIYYVFFITGQLMLGKWSGLPGYDDFRLQWHQAVSPDLDWLGRIEASAKLVVADWGLTLLIGSLPFTVIGSWLGYRLTYRFVVRYRRARAERIARRRLRHSGA